MDLDDYRRFYADEIRLAACLKSQALANAFARVPREKFLGPSPWKIASPEQAVLMTMGLSDSAYTTTDDPRDLYHNLLVAIDASRHLNNGQPSALARWMDAMDLKAGDRVYHLGCGVGYYTAILADAVGTTGTVVGSEVDSALAVRARANLTGYPNVAVHDGDGANFDPGACDAMLINAGVTHPHEPWLERLADGGHLVLPITTAMGKSNFGQGVVVCIMRRRDRFSARVVTHVAIYDCATMRDPEMEPIIGKAVRSPLMTKIRSLRRDAHEAADTCVMHGRTFCLSTDEIAG